MTHYSLHHKHQGASLFIALIMLLIITLLAISSTRESTLESRITGNLLEQQTLTNYAEAALREGELQLTNKFTPAEPDCTSKSEYCFRNEDADYSQDFDESLTYSAIRNTDRYSIRWYAIPVASDLIEYGDMALGRGAFYYEINAEALNNYTDQKINLRSTTVKVFNP